MLLYKYIIISYYFISYLKLQILRRVLESRLPISIYASCNITRQSKHALLVRHSISQLFIAIIIQIHTFSIYLLSILRLLSFYGTRQYDLLISILIHDMTFLNIGKFMF